MVYCGKPSKGCENCRAKRLKVSLDAPFSYFLPRMATRLMLVQCDQKRPGCGQCRNTGRECLGYRDPTDLVFRDESQQILIKYRKKAEAKKTGTVRTLTARQKNNNGQSYCKVSELRQNLETPKEFKIPPSLQHPIQDVAINFLLGDYIRGSHFNYLPSLYGANSVKSILSPCVKAVGLACLSLQTSRPELEDDAQRLYVDAIAVTNTALQCTDTARSDNVLASVLLLSLYETLSRRTKVNIDAWTTHMQGALALVALRGPCQFQSQLGLELFKQIAASIRVFCVQHVIRIPRQLRELTQLAKGFSYPSDVSFEIPCIVEAFTDLRADMAEGNLSEPSGLIARVQGVLDMIEDFYLKLPQDWKYDTVRIRSLSPQVHGDRYYHFRNHHVAQIWNTTWMAKLHLNSLIYERVLHTTGNSSQLPTSDADPVTVMNACEREVIEAAENICASVPQFFPPNANLSLPGNSRTAAMGYFLIWPLFTAGASPLIMAPTKEYIVERLVFISQDLKLPQAQKAAEMLVHDDCEESWMHMYHCF